MNSKEAGRGDDLLLGALPKHQDMLVHSVNSQCFERLTFVITYKITVLSSPVAIKPTTLLQL